ncbi:MAG: cytidylate kinase-like family protein [Prevotella sp.]|nr:cytidylate kinase-like family protein [Prevotella sp.]
MIITIARQCGCGAIHIGRILSQRYGLQLYTRKNLMEMAERKGLLTEMSDFFEESPVDDLLNAISSFTEEHEAIRSRFCHTFNKMIGSEDCIIIGRCGNHIFRQRPDLISVFLHGDIKQRICFTAEEEGVSPEVAKERVNDTDDQRAAYHQYYTGLTWGNAADYDLSIDSCRLGAEGSAHIIDEYIKSTYKG